MTGKETTYKSSGVDINFEEYVIKELSERITYKRKGFGAPLTDIGHYAGLIEFGDYALALTTDGVGSKMIIANKRHKWDTVGIDCIAMNVNDLLAIGVEPLSFVDYIAVEKPNAYIMGEIGKGLQKGAEISNITIVGGETASLPDILTGTDLAGTCLGFVKKNRIITGEKIVEGDVIVGLPSSGLHSNGYSLARKIIEESEYRYYHKLPNKSVAIGEELLTPTKIYMEILDVIKKCEVHGMAHITGGGLLKLKRISKLGFDICDPLEPQLIFRFLQELGEVETLEMYKTFNMGMGFLIVLPEKDAQETVRITKGKVIGRIQGSKIRVKELIVE